MADENTNERAERGREILRSRSAQGEPGTKQPAHKGPGVEAQQVVDDLRAITEKHSAETRGPSAGETKNHPVPDAERDSFPPITGGGIQSAAGAVAAAQAHIESELITEARLASDPRRELDQKKFKMGQRGELAFVPPAPEEVAAQAERSGVDPSVLDQIPKSPSEQVARDMPRLEQAEKTAREVKGAANQAVDSTEAVRDSQIRTGAGKATVAPSTGAPARPATGPTEGSGGASSTAATGTGGSDVSGGSASPPSEGTPIK